MKYLVLLTVLVVAYLLWRGKRIDAPRRPGEAAPPVLPQDMVRCPVCALHLPRAEALAAPDGRFFCSAEHRRLGTGG